MSINNSCSQKDDSEDPNKDTYVIIVVKSLDKIDFQELYYETDNKIKPSLIFQESMELKDKSFLQEIVFKLKKRQKKETDNQKEKADKYKIKFTKEEKTYNITFSLNNKCFIFQPELKKGNKFLPIFVEESIKQNIIPLYNKLNIFLLALKNNNELEIKEKKLYEDTIALYEEKKQFSLLITLFLKIYKKYEVLCSRLIKIFYEINSKENSDRIVELKKEVNSFKDIYSNSQDILEKFHYEKVHFYGIIFCYLHYYDEKNFPQMIEEFSEGNIDLLCEIFIQYHSHFSNPLKQSKEFYYKFIKYVLNKDNKELKIFNRALNYIEDIETYLYVINSNKKEIFEKYKELSNDPIKIPTDLKLKKYKIEPGIIVGVLDKNEKNDSSDEEDNYGKEDEKLENECDAIKKMLEEIISFSKKENIIAINLTSSFWIRLIEQYNSPDWVNLSNCRKLRDIFKEYNKLINDICKADTIEYKIEDEKIENYKKIKNDINRFFERDQFAFMLDANIKEFLKKNKKLSYTEILTAMVYYNPYFNIENKEDKERFKNYRDVYIFDYINYNEINEEFISNFIHLNFETMFETRIRDYIKKMTDKINNIESFGNVIKLITIERLKEENVNDYFRILEDKYTYYIKNSIKSIKDEAKLSESIKIIAEFISKIFLFEKKTNRFLDNEISKLDENIKSLIYIELISTYKEEKYQEQKNRIYEIYLEKIETKEGRENIIKFLPKLEVKDREYFIYNKIIRKCIFNKDEFFSNHEDYKIQTLCLLNEEVKNNKIELNILDKSRQGDKPSEDLVNILDIVKDELEKDAITKKNLENFLNIKRKKGKENNNGVVNDESNKYVINKLKLIKLATTNYDPYKKYHDYIRTIETINEKVDELRFIKDSLMIFHRILYNDDIQKIGKLLEEIEDNSIKYFKSPETGKSLEELSKHKPLCEKIKKVIDFLLFKKIFEKAQGNNQLERFNDAIKKLEGLKTLFINCKSSNIGEIFNNKEYMDIFKKIKEDISIKSNDKSKEFIKQMIDYFEVKDKKIENGIKIIINSKKYENIVKSIEYFFKNFLNKELILPKNINLSEINDLTELEHTLEQLKRDNIFDYDSNNNYYKIFTSIYEKKEAIDFLIEKRDKVETLKIELINKINPTNRNITVDDINVTIDCLKEFNKLNELGSTKEIMEYLYLLGEEKINKFERFSKKFGSIIELDNKKEEDNFKEVYDIIKDAKFIFNLDGEDFSYDNDDKKIKNIEYLINLKNKINIPNEKKIRDNWDKNDKKKEIEGEKSEKDAEKDAFEEKCKKLVFFKDIISNLEIIYEKMVILRQKGFNIPIIITIAIEYEKAKEKEKKVSYKLNNKQTEFNKIKEYLFKVKIDYEKRLDIIYKDEKYLRLLYGKFFRQIRKHQGGDEDISEIIRYILNKPTLEKDTKDEIKEADHFYNVKLGEDYENLYDDYTESIFKGISQYLIDLFKKNNGCDLRKHYENMLIQPEFDDKNNKINKSFKEITYSTKCIDL